MARTDEAEWVPLIPVCVRCRRPHWAQWIVFADDGPVGEDCLTDSERAAWCRPTEAGHGKVDLPKAGK